MPLFQSSPNLSAGCNQRADPHTVIHRSFNPHPTSRLGVASRTGRLLGLLSGFNPHPTSWLGASWESELAGRYLAWFQSSPNREAGCSLDYSANSCCKFQSSPNLLVRCSLIFPRIMKVGFFNSHPTSGLGAMSPSFQLLLVDVSILTQLLGWVQCCRIPVSSLTPTSRLGAARAR